MKKLLLLVVYLVFLPGFFPVVAQCVVKNTIVQINSSTTSGSNCIINFDFIFTIENNGGNKYIYVHAWLQNQYPNYFTCPTVPSNAKAPVAADLINAKINLAIHNEVHVGHPAPTLQTSYIPDPNVVLTPATQLIRQVYPTGDSARFTVKGVQITVPLACSNVITMVADFWSSQAQNGSQVHCVSCSNTFTIDPRISGSLGCTIPRNINLVISSVAPVSISGTYQLFVDNPSDPLNESTIGSFGPEDLLVRNASFNTTVSTFINQFVVSGINYEPYSSQKPEADRNLWVLVQTDGYTNRALGYLVNTCAPLPLRLQEFKVVYRNEKVQLTWMAEQMNADRFEVQRKFVNGSFVTIATIPVLKQDGAPSFNALYSYTDEGFDGSGPVYYRLLVKEPDGRVFYSDIRAITTKGSTAVLIFPNPARDVVNIILPSDAGMMDVTLNDFSGKTIQRWIGLQQQQMQIFNLVPGIYLLRIHNRNSGEQLLQRIIVQ